MKHPVSLAVILIVAIAAVSLRLWDLADHFSHIDDLGVVATLVKEQGRPAHTRDSLREALEREQWSLAGRNKLSLFNLADETGLLESFITLSNKIERIRRFGQNWTYAPGQFLLTDSLVHKELSYREKLRNGRLPSLLLGLIALMVWLYFLNRYSQVGSVTPVAFTLVALSWENIIYAKQQESYAVAVLS